MDQPEPKLGEVSLYHKGLRWGREFRFFPDAVELQADRGRGVVRSLGPLRLLAHVLYDLGHGCAALDEVERIALSK